MEYSLVEMEAVHEAYEIALDELEAARREPDRWEESCLVRSLTAMVCGLYRMGAVELQVYATPQGDRPCENESHFQHTPQKFTTEDLRRGLAQVRMFAMERP